METSKDLNVISKAVLFLAAVMVMIVIVIVVKGIRNEGSRDTPSTPSDVGTAQSVPRPSAISFVRSAPAEGSGKTPVREPGREIVRIPPPGLEQSAKDFPHNLNTFNDWGMLTAEQLKSYRPSLISRVGRWKLEGISRFFFAADSKFTDPAAKGEFRNAILGVWCAKDVENCLAMLDETLPEQSAKEAKRQALAGWAREDWLSALRYLQRVGDIRIEANLGGDCTSFIRNLICEVSASHGLEEARGILSQIKRDKNITAARGQLEILDKVNHTK